MRIVGSDVATRRVVRGEAAHRIAPFGSMIDTQHTIGSIEECIGAGVGWCLYNVFSNNNLGAAVED
jgi:hypothetical protein